jgi:hypothetical protein
MPLKLLISRCRTVGISFPRLAKLMTDAAGHAEAVQDGGIDSRFFEGADEARALSKPDLGMRAGIFLPIVSLASSDTCYRKVARSKMRTGLRSSRPAARRRSLRDGRVNEGQLSCFDTRKLPVR